MRSMEAVKQGCRSREFSPYTYNALVFRKYSIVLITKMKKNLNVAVNFQILYINYLLIFQRLILLIIILYEKYQPVPYDQYC